jgi:signal transduction histidine kinase
VPRGGGATLTELSEGGVYRHLDALGKHLDAALTRHALSSQAQLSRVGPIVWPYFDKRGALPVAASAINPAAIDEYHRRYRGWLAHGVYLPPSAYEVCFLSAAHTTADVDKLLDVLATSEKGLMRSGFRQWFAERAELIVLGLTMLTTASLVIWWTILLRGEMRTNEQLELEVLQLQADSISLQQRDARLSEIAAHHQSRTVMLVGESTLLGLLLSGSLVLLFPGGAATQAAARRHGKTAAVHQPRVQDAGGRREGPAAEPGDRQHSRRAARRAHPPRPARVRPARTPGGDHPRLPARHVARAARRRAAIDAARFIADLLTHRARTASGGEVQVAVVDAVQVLADRDGLRVILENLLDNAHKYGGGSVRLAAGVSDGHWRLDISDQGRGFPPESAEKALRPPQPRQRRGRHARRGPGPRDRAPAGAAHGRRHSRPQSRPRAGRGVHGHADAGAAVDAAVGRRGDAWLTASPSSRTSVWCASSWPSTCGTRATKS